MNENPTPQNPEITSTKAHPLLSLFLVMTASSIALLALQQNANAEDGLSPRAIVDFLSECRPNLEALKSDSERVKLIKQELAIVDQIITDKQIGDLERLARTKKEYLELLLQMYKLRLTHNLEGDSQTIRDQFLEKSTQASTVKTGCEALIKDRENIKDTRDKAKKSIWDNMKESAKTSQEAHETKILTAIFPSSKDNKNKAEKLPTSIDKLSYQNYLELLNEPIETPLPPGSDIFTQRRIVKNNNVAKTAHEKLRETLQTLKLSPPEDPKDQNELIASARYHAQILLATIISNKYLLFIATNHTNVQISGPSVTELTLALKTEAAQANEQVLVVKAEYDKRKKQFKPKPPKPGKINVHLLKDQAFLESINSQDPNEFPTNLLEKYNENYAKNEERIKDIQLQRLQTSLQLEEDPDNGLLKLEMDYYNSCLLSTLLLRRIMELESDKKMKASQEARELYKQLRTHRNKLAEDLKKELEK